MKIKSIRVYQVDLPLNKPYWLSGGRLKFEKLDSTIVALLDDCPVGDTITFDVNRAWLPSEAVVVMNATADSRAFFEQPCETLDQCRQVRELTRHPIIIDESLQTFQDLLWAHRHNVAQAIGLKIGRVGGLTKAKMMRNFCVAAGIMMNIEDTGGSKIADTAAVHLALSTPPVFDRATWDCSQHHSVITAQGGYNKRNGRATTAELPGLGVVVDETAIGEPVAIYSS